MTLTYKQALLAAYTILDDLHDQTNDAALFDLLNDMNPFVFADHTSADPATWAEWVGFARENQKGERLTPEAVSLVLTTFLRHNESEYGYHANRIIQELKMPSFQQRWKDLLQKSSELKEL